MIHRSACSSARHILVAAAAVVWLSLLLLNFQTSSHTSADDKSRRNSSEERSRPNSGDEKRKLSLSEGKVKKNVGEGKKRVSSGSAERGSKPPLKRAQEQSPRKRGRPPKDEKVCLITVASGLSDLLVCKVELDHAVCFCSTVVWSPVLSAALKKPASQMRDGCTGLSPPEPVYLGWPGRASDKGRRCPRGGGVDVLVQLEDS